MRLRPRFSLPILSLLLTLLAASPSVSALELPKIFASHMVLQRDLPVPLWGTAEAGSTVTATFDGQRVTTETGPDGRWQLALRPMDANATGQTLTLTSGTATVSFEDVLIGEVWLGSGQSNMVWPVRQSLNAETEIAQANHPTLRLATVPTRVAGEPQSDAAIRWVICSPASIPSFSAVAYTFARELQQTLDVPVGVINSSWGGTQAEAWLSREALADDPVLIKALPSWQEKVTGYPMRLARWQEQETDVNAKRAEWLAENPEKTAQEAERQFPLARKPVEPERDAHTQAAIYNAMIRPLAPYAIRGVIWYQGESNAGRATQYRTLLPLLIADWRSLWGQGDFPFGIVQLANYRAVAEEPTDPTWAHVRDAQRFTSLTVPNTGLAVTIDIGEANDIHPRNKHDVGKRLAAWALNEVYGQDALRFTGPVYESFEVRENKVLIRFREFGGRLTTRDGQAPAEFILSGSDKKWVWAQAQITGPYTLEVWAEGVSDPVAVRYAWANNPVNPNLTNDSTFPASPFRTDDWPVSRR